jgi:hypothetical protein
MLYRIHEMSDIDNIVWAFPPKKEGYDLTTLSGQTRINVYFLGLTDGETLVVTTKIDDIPEVIRSFNHKVAVFEALKNLDDQRANFQKGACSVDGRFGADGEPKIHIQIGLVDPEN